MSTAYRVNVWSGWHIAEEGAGQLHHTARHATAEAATAEAAAYLEQHRLTALSQYGEAPDVGLLCIDPDERHVTVSVWPERIAYRYTITVCTVERTQSLTYGSRRAACAQFRAEMAAAAADPTLTDQPKRATSIWQREGTSNRARTLTYTYGPRVPWTDGPLHWRQLSIELERRPII